MALSKEKVTQEIRESAAEFIGIDASEVDLNKKLRLDYGVSSIDAAELIMTMEDNYGIKIPLEEAQKILTCQQAIDYVLANAK